MNFQLTVIMAMAAFLLSGCATIFSKSSYPLYIRSTPANAKISVTDKTGKEIYLGNTPTTIKLKSGARFFSRAEYQVRFSSPGYDDRVVTVNFKLDNWYFGNLLLGGVLGMLIIDPATGAMWRIETPVINEQLKKTSDNPELTIMNINEIPGNWKDHLVKIN